MIKIINNTDFYYKELGELIDNIQWTHQAETQYEGQTMTLNVKFKRVPLKIHIRQMKKGVEWRFDVNE